MRKLVFAVYTLFLIGCSSPSGAQSPKADEEQNVLVHFAQTPKTLDFAGEKVPLHYPDVKEALQKEMSITMYMHSRTLNMLRATKRYFPQIEKTLKQYGIPDDFKYLCMAESAMNPNAQSGAGAAGLWQFIPSAAKDFGIETGDNVDLRFHEEQSAIAAAKYLKKAYDRYGNWTMAAASYNVGMAGVARRAAAQGVESYYDLFLPEETMRYVFRILAMKLVEQNPEKYGFELKQEDYQKPFSNFTTVKISDAQIDWSAFAAKHDTNYKVLRMLNPWIRTYEYANKTGKTYTVKVPNKDFRTKGY